VGGHGLEAINLDCASLSQVVLPLGGRASPCAARVRLVPGPPEKWLRFVIWACDPTLPPKRLAPSAVEYRMSSRYRYAAFTIANSTVLATSAHGGTNSISIRYRLRSDFGNRQKAWLREPVANPQLTRRLRTPRSNNRASQECLPMVICPPGLQSPMTAVRPDDLDTTARGQSTQFAA
jgi:hypothetical protein